MKIEVTDRIIIFTYHILFFLVPLILTPWNFELFEFNKMMLTYFLTVIIASLWLIKMITVKQIIFNKTPFDLLLLLFLISQITSTLLSWDRHVSVFGYYSRFNGGLLSTFSYLILFYAFVSNFQKSQILKLLRTAVISAIFVTVYGILEHFGIDRHIWVQDVQNRVFSTLGQPNWLAAFLAVLIPVTTSLSLIKTPGKEKFLYTVAVYMYFITLIYTKSRSGFLGLMGGLGIFWLLYFLKFKKETVKPFLVQAALLFAIVFLFGAPFRIIEKYTLPQLLNSSNSASVSRSVKPVDLSIIDVGITESGEIRNIVWKGAINIFKNYPVFGTGTESFALAYFKYRPVEHNMTSEWDFLYNKAHNEYLNYAATTGMFGLGSYLLIIGVFIFYFLKQFKNISFKSSPPAKFVVSIGLFSAWLTVLITNFFGFSVVITQLYFFLIPAVVYLYMQDYAVLPGSPEKYLKRAIVVNFRQNMHLSILLVIVCLTGLFLVIRLIFFWVSDFYFAKGHSQSKSQEFASAYKNIKTAVFLNPNESFYLDELAFPAAQIGLYLYSENKASDSAVFIKEALFYNEKALNISPKNVNYWKTKTRILYNLSQIDQNYLPEAIKALEVAKKLSPTDPKIRYNLALMYDTSGQSKKAYFELDDTVKLKVNYRDAWLAKGIFHARDGNYEKAIEALEFILTRINPNDDEARKQLEELQNKI